MEQPRYRYNFIQGDTGETIEFLTYTSPEEMRPLLCEYYTHPEKRNEETLVEFLVSKGVEDLEDPYPLNVFEDWDKMEVRFNGEYMCKIAEQE